MLSNRYIARSCLSTSSIHKERLIAALVGGSVALSLLVLAAVFYYTQLRRPNPLPHGKQLLSQNNTQYSSPSKHIRSPATSIASKVLPRLEHVHKSPVSTLPYWKRKSLPPLPARIWEVRRSIHNTPLLPPTPDWLTRPIRSPQVVNSPRKVVVADKPSSAGAVLDDAIGLGLDLSECYSPSVYSTQMSRASSSTLFEEYMALIALPTHKEHQAYNAV
jgi:hypothetical protein